MKSWDEVGLSDDFMFGKVMQDPDLCKELLRRILPEIEIDHIEYPELQKAMKPDRDDHGIRLDLYVRDDKNSVYDIELQAVNTGELPKRSRYYQSIIDLQLIDAGESYKKLSQSYIIFICLEDVFGYGRHKYTFSNLCEEDKHIRLEDKTTKIFLNASGTMDDVDDKLKVFLDFVADKEVDAEDEYIKRLQIALEKARRNKDWRHEYMTLQMRDQENIERGIAIGKQEGLKEGEEKNILSSIRKLMNNLKLPMNSAMDALEIPDEQRAYYAEQLKN